MDARKRPELVIALNEECVLGAFERNLRPARLVNERVRIFGEECELSKGRPRWDCREGEQTDATGGEGRQDAVRSAQFVADVYVVVIDWPDREGDRTPPRVESP